MNARRAITADKEALYAACLATVAPAENNRMRAVMGLMPVTVKGAAKAEDKATRRVAVDRQAAARDRLAKAFSGGDGWVATHVLANAAGMSLGRAREYLRDMADDGLVSRRYVSSSRGKTSEWSLGGGKSEAWVTVKDRILAHLGGVPERWFTTAMICEEVGVPETTAGSELRDLSQCGLVEYVHGKPRSGGSTHALWRAVTPGVEPAPLPDATPGRERLMSALSGEWQRPSALAEASGMSTETIRRHMWSMLRAGTADRRYTPGAYGMGHSVEWRRGTGQDIREQTVSERVIAALRAKQGRDLLKEDLCAATGAGHVHAELVLQALRKAGLVASRLEIVRGRRRTFWRLAEGAAQ